MPAPVVEIPGPARRPERVLRLALDEGLSRPSRLHMSWLDDAEQDVAQLLGKEIRVYLPGAATSAFEGVIIAASPGSGVDGRGEMHIEARDPFSLRKGFARYRVFENKKVSEIAAAVLGHSLDLSGADDAVVPVAVQYGESDYAFLRRLLWESGLVYSVQGPTLKAWADANEASAEPLRCRYREHLEHFKFRHRIRPLKQQAIAHNLEAEGLQLKRDEIASVGPAGAASSQTFAPYENQIYLGSADPNGPQEALVRQTLATNLGQGRGRSLQPGVRPGGVLDVMGMPKASLNGPYLVTRVLHKYESPTQGGGGQQDYENTFWCVPRGRTVLPRRQPTRREIPGLQLGVVVAPTAEANSDPLKVGRVRVRLPWMGQAPGCQGFSPWARVLQSDAGKNHGTLFLPDVGDEVLVAFEMGDPARPFVLGSLYGVQSAPQPPPTYKNDRKAIVTRSGGVILLEDTDETTSRICVYQGKAEDAANAIRLDGAAQAVLEISSKGSIRLIGQGNGEVFLQQGAGSIKITSAGDIEIKGRQILIAGERKITGDGGEEVAFKGTRLLWN